MRHAVSTLGQTIVMVTHDPVAASYADSAVVLVDGRIVDQIAEPSTGKIFEYMRALEG
jgi:putative ABC transport system ATP-binding protein